MLQKQREQRFSKPARESPIGKNCDSQRGRWLLFKNTARVTSGAIGEAGAASISVCLCRFRILAPPSQPHGACPSILAHTVAPPLWVYLEAREATRGVHGGMRVRWCGVIDTLRCFGVGLAHAEPVEAMPQGHPEEISGARSGGAEVPGGACIQGQ
jgi:hypothetical protein